MSLYDESNYNHEKTENQCEGLVSLAWVDPSTGNFILTPQMMAVVVGGGIPQTNAIPPATQNATQGNDDVYTVAIAKHLKLGEKAHIELQERLQKKQPREQAVKEIAARMNKPAYIIKAHLSQYIKHLKNEKSKEYRAVIIQGLKAGETDRVIAKNLGLNEKTIASKRRAIERELLEGAK